MTNANERDLGPAATYDIEWRNIIEPNGSFDKDQLKKELYDYSFLMRQASAVYCEVTGNRMSKTGYYADDVIRCFHERLEEWIDEAIAEELKDAVMKLGFEDGDVLVWRTMDENAPKVMKQLVDSLNARGTKILGVVFGDGEISMLDEAAMNEAGWFRND